MEPERRKLFKNKIKNCLEPETPEKVKRKKTVERNKNQGDSTSERPKNSLKNMPKTVTVLSSHSYMEQNKDLLVLQPLEGEKISHNGENILEDQLQNKNNTEINDDEIIDVSDTANPLIDKTAKKTDNENRLETEKVHCQQEITATDTENLKIYRTQNREDNGNLFRNAEVHCRQENTATDTENLDIYIIDRTQNKEDTENISKTEVERCQQEEKLHSEPSQEKEREKDESLENREHLNTYDNGNYS